MMTDESVVEWALGWLRDNTPEYPTFRESFASALRGELAARRSLVERIRARLGPRIRDYRSAVEAVREMLDAAPVGTIDSAQSAYDRGVRDALAICQQVRGEAGRTRDGADHCVDRILALIDKGAAGGKGEAKT